MTDPLREYRSKRDPDRTPEPVPAEEPRAEGRGDSFVVQEHHARRLHWDFRLERDGVLVSWAVPKGLPMDPKTNHLAVQTEDHPLDYGSFEGEIPKGEYGAGKVIIWDRGRYETEKWSNREVMVVLHGDRVRGRYVLFRTTQDWMIHRMDPPPDPDWQPMPDRIDPRPVERRTRLPRDEASYAYEFAWGGERAMAFVEGGRVRLMIDGDDVISTFPELRALGRALGSRQLVLDGELIAFGRDGRPDPEGVSRRRAETNANRIRRLSRDIPITYLIFDLLHLDGRAVAELPYEERRRLLDDLRLAGPSWQTTPWFEGDGVAVRSASREQGLPGVVAKRLDSPYAGKRGRHDWFEVPN